MRALIEFKSSETGGAWETWGVRNGTRKEIRESAENLLRELREQEKRPWYTKVRIDGRQVVLPL